MSHIAIARVHEGKDDSPSFLEELKTVTEQIRDRAFGLFQRRGACDGSPLNDWLQAERDLTCVTESDLTEKDSGFQLQVAVPGFAEKDIKVTALPDALLVTAESTHRHEANEGNVHFCEFDGKQFFRRFELPKAIDVDKVTAQLDKGVLRVTAGKAQPKELKASAA